MINKVKEKELFDNNFSFDNTLTDKQKRKIEAKYKKVICIDTNVIYKNAKEASKECQATSTTIITNICKKGGGKVKLKNGQYLTFKYL